MLIHIANHAEITLFQVGDCNLAAHICDLL